MPELSINMGAVKKFVAKVATELTLDACEQVKECVEANSPFSVKVYQGGNPDYRIVEIIYYVNSDEENVCKILKSDFLGDIVSIELIFTK